MLLFSELRRWWGLTGAFIGSQRPHDPLELHLEFRVASFPAGEVGGESGFDLLSLATRSLEENAVKIERNRRQHLRTAFLHQVVVFREGNVDLIID